MGENEAESCAFADQNWHLVPKEAPKLELCWQSQDTLEVDLDDEKYAENPWHLCKSRARAEIYGDVTTDIRYKLTKKKGSLRGASTYLCGGDDSDCSFGAVKNRFTTHSGTDSYALGEIVEGDYTLFVRVCDKDDLCSTSNNGWYEQRIVIKRSKSVNLYAEEVLCNSKPRATWAKHWVVSTGSS